MLGHLRPYVTWLKKALAWPYLKLGMGPGAVGLFGVALAALAALLFRAHYHQTAFWLAMIAVLTDMADGEVARAQDCQSPEGNYWDALGDRLREGLLLVGLLPTAPDLVIVALMGTYLVSFAKARCALVVIMDNRDWPGFGDHPDRAVMLLIAYQFHHSWWPIALLAVATWTCFFARSRFALGLIRNSKESELLPYLR